MSKVLVLGDTHGRTLWKEAIAKENPDFVVFLGDYVSTHDLVSAEQQLENLKEILDYKEEHPETTVLLRGNHDTQHLGYHWAECSGYDRKVASGMHEMSERFLKNTQWVYILDNIIMSHAGISQVWLDNTVEPYVKNILGKDTTNPLEEINNIEPCEVFGFIPESWYDSYGQSRTQSLTWIRPESLLECAVEGYTQIVGHTPVKQATGIKTVSGDTIWLCDCQGVKQYIVINDGVIEAATSM